MAVIGWSRDEAISMLIRLQDRISPVGFHVGMAGSVLTRGFSRKDLDVLIYPHDTTKCEYYALRQAFVEFGMAELYTAEFIKEQWVKAGSRDTKHVEVWSAPKEYGSKRIDIFLVK